MREANVRIGRLYKVSQTSTKFLFGQRSLLIPLSSMPLSSTINIRGETCEKHQLCSDRSLTPHNGRGTG